MTHAQRFRDIYEECYPRVLAYATSLVGRQVGEDITSETFTVAWRRVRDIPRPPLPWLLGVARNLVRELRRRDAHQYALAAAEAQQIGRGARGETGDVAADVTERDAALQALASLSEADRELLTLIAWHGLSARQAARVLGCTTATLTVRLHRARRRLEKALDPAHPAHPAHPAPAAPVRKAHSTPPVPPASPTPPVSPTPHAPQAPGRTDRRGALT
ncbi:sigma-70 family RNA polymerase sigma factor [Streptomyces scabiei]|uniref:RNA polymerase sigma factor n=1 Tax=Streptomyces scabiei TaxID=1930 RepID=UPI001B310749|nr:MULTISPECIES: sigma-70 family RNA polymerase sigma factor [Streptomyces]MBP5867995.1 sigma-70 family RNA polymerase sigma factor [Streptomyces sp. LBUM 1485]MBP5916195.1 sigma-70 family RNA polymerase sigma factor [Streptomyces sp. LBUM 1486]MDX3212497.1 sigma-70 family RNA polymerase sigma factor [Streptomyces scabiei]QTU54603.1 sigma-70 family RNA polymerase sigma factor [Streptomyces sp. LBUM 1480]